MNTKICCKCNQEKHTNDFHKRKNNKDGLYTYCKQCKKEDDQKYSNKNKTKILEHHKEYYQKNKERISEQKREYQQRTADKRRKYKREYEKQRKDNDPLYRLTQNYKNRINKALKGIGIKSKATEELLGCSVKDFWNHLENQFKDGMNWENQGKWHVDHITPIASATTIEEREKLFHYSNCQPLWAKENLAKADKIISNG
jgi:hypothetical protein